MPIDYRDYAPDRKAIRAGILERAGHKCEECGVPDQEVGIRTRSGLWVKAPAGYAPGDWFAGVKCIRIVLTVAHLDHNPGNNDPANLRAWCQLHHNRYDAAHRAASRRRRAG